jgi:hypothetical protein
LMGRPMATMTWPAQTTRHLAIHWEAKLDRSVVDIVAAVSSKTY